MHRIWIIVCLLAVPAAAPLSIDESRSASAKLTRVAEDEMEPGERITLSDDEINSYLLYDYAEYLPDGVEGLQVKFEPDIGVVTGVVDFAKVSAQGGGGNFLLAMLSGERDLEARVRYVSANGLANVDVESLKIDGREMKGPILTYLVNTFVVPDLEGFKLGEPVPLGHNLEQVRLEAGQAIFIAAD